MTASLNQRQDEEIAAKIKTLVLIVAAGLVPLIGITLPLEEPSRTVSYFFIMANVGLLEVLYFKRNSKYREIFLYAFLISAAISISASGPLSGVASPHVWVLCQLIPPVATFILGKPYSTAIMAVITGVILSSFVLAQTFGAFPIQIQTLPPRTLLLGLPMQLIVLGVVAAMVTTFAKRDRKARDTLEKTNLQLLKAKESAEAANLSHELRTPLTSLLNGPYLLTQYQDVYGSISQEQQKILNIAHQDAETLNDLINDILDLAKIDAGQKLEVHYDVVDIKSLISSVTSTVLALKGTKPIEFVTNIPDDLPEIIGHRTTILRICQNLFSNAVKFTEQGTIIFSAKSLGDKFVQFSVQDTGIGVAVENQEIIFEDFRQVHTGLSKEYEGTGLGLAITKKLVQLQGGKIWMESDGLGFGTTFFFTIPVQLKSEEGSNKSSEVVALNN